MPRDLAWLSRPAILRDLSASRQSYGRRTRQWRLGHVTLSRQHSVQTASEEQLSSRWLSDLRSRVGRCMQFGLSAQQVEEAGLILREMNADWRALVAGSQGFLTSEDRRQLFKYPVAWGDMDIMGHVNNVMYIRYAETARALWFRNFAARSQAIEQHQWQELWTPRGTGVILKSIKMNYKLPLRYPDKITVWHKLAADPRVSKGEIVLEVLILSERYRRPAATAEEHVLMYDYASSQRVDLPEFMRRQFQDTYERQLETARENTGLVRNLQRRVTELEKESWDRPDAKEDFGGP